MATKKTTTSVDLEEQPFDLLAVLDRPSDTPTRPATLGEITVNVKTSWVGVEVAAVSTAMATGVKDVLCLLVPDAEEAAAAWEFIGNLRQDVAVLVVQEMLKLAGLATDKGFLAHSASSEMPAGGAER